MVAHLAERERGDGEDALLLNFSHYLVRGALLAGCLLVTPPLSSWQEAHRPSLPPLGYCAHAVNIRGRGERTWRSWSASGMILITAALQSER